jgi:hypothetical protein
MGSHLFISKYEKVVTQLSLRSSDALLNATITVGRPPID